MGVCHHNDSLMEVEEGVVPQCVRSCKNVYHDERDLVSCRSQCFLNVFYIELAKCLPNRFEYTPQQELSGYISEHSYSEHSKVEARVLRMNEYRGNRESLYEQNYKT